MNSTKNSSLAPYFTASISAALIWALMVIPIRQLHDYNPFSILLSRIFLVPILMFLFIFLFNKKALKADVLMFKNNEIATKKKIVFLLFFSSLCLALNWFTYIYLVAKIDIKSASLVYVICPLILAIGSFLIYKDAIDKFKVLSLLIALIAIIFLALDHLETILYVLFCSTAYAIFMLLQKGLPTFNRFNLFAFETILIFLISLPFFIEKINVGEIGFEWFYWSRLFLIATAFTIFPMFLNLYSLSKLPGSSVAMIIYLNPIGSFLIGILVFGEDILIKEAFVYLTLLISVIIFNFPRMRELLKV